MRRLTLAVAALMLSVSTAAAQFSAEDCAGRNEGFPAPSVMLICHDPELRDADWLLSVLIGRVLDSMPALEADKHRTTLTIQFSERVRCGISRPCLVAWYQRMLRHWLDTPKGVSL